MIPAVTEAKTATGTQSENRLPGSVTLSPGPVQADIVTMTSTKGTTVGWTSRHTTKMACHLIAVGITSVTTSHAEAVMSNHAEITANSHDETGIGRACHHPHHLVKEAEAGIFMNLQCSVNGLSTHNSSLQGMIVEAGTGKPSSLGTTHYPKDKITMLSTHH